MKLQEWVDECKYIAEQAEPFVRGYGPSEYEDKAQFLRYCTMQRNSAAREGFHDSAQYIQHCIDDLANQE
jgi:hypothetical protein